ncbi:arginine decarboxylase [Clostridia bacterium]|nr:arginine decarboxylase [Clostridia bacterium]
MVYNFVSEYIKKNVYPFHIPGHKGNPAFFPKDIFSFDITEIPGADNLHAPTGVIAELEKFIAKLYGADDSVFSVNGGSAGVLAALLHVSSFGSPSFGRVIIARNSHRSAYHAVIMAAARHSFAMPQQTEYGFSGSVTPQEVERAILANRYATAVFITSPTYEGVVSDIRGISAVTRKYGKLLIVDEAHGSHFVFSDFFPDSAVKCGADIVINSLQKTLPVLGQCAVVHINERDEEQEEAAGDAPIEFPEERSKERFRRFMSFVQTSSPSYMLMAQADYALKKLCDEPVWFTEYAKNLAKFREDAKKFKNIRLFDGGKGVFALDKSKLVFCFSNAPNAEKLLAENGVQIEMSGLNYLVAVTSPADTKDGFDRLFAALIELDKIASPPERFNGVLTEPLPEPVRYREMKTAFLAERELVPIERAVGRVSGDFITPYPPGVPIAAPSEYISERVVSRTLRLVELGVTVNGLTADNRVSVVKKLLPHDVEDINDMDDYLKCGGRCNEAGR